MKLEELKDKKILILGFGREGQDTYFGLRKLFPNKPLGIADQNKFSIFNFQFSNLLKKDKNIRLYFGDDYLNRVGDCELVIKAPGIPLTKVKPFLRRGAKITSQTEIFFDNFKGIIIGVTGTKGKGTTCSLIYSILRKAGFKAHLVGNIGKPVFQLLLQILKQRDQGIKEIVVYELSSHQLQGLKKSPQIAVFLNLFPDHLDYYKDLKEYYRAKESIFKFQTKDNYFVYNIDDKKVRTIAKKSRAKKIPVSLKTPLTTYERSLKSCYQLKGGFNWFNLRAAVEAAKILNIPARFIKQGVKTFNGLPERLERIGKFRGIQFYSDSMSTLPEVTVAALQALEGKVKTLLVGGSDKGSDYSQLAEQILEQRVENIILLGKGTGQKIAEHLKSKSKKSKADSNGRGAHKKSSDLQIFQTDSMKQAVKIAFEQTKKGEICLLSPGSASFNLFKDYKARGEEFKKWIRHYGK